MMPLFKAILNNLSVDSVTRIKLNGTRQIYGKDKFEIIFLLSSQVQANNYMTGRGYNQRELPLSLE